MGRAVRGSNEHVTKRARIDERPTKKFKKRKRRGELNDIRRKIVKAEDKLDADKKNAEGAKEKTKPRAPAKISNRILPRPSGIYRNGARGKEIRKAQKNLSAKDLDDARLVSDVFALVNGEECGPQYVEREDAAISDDSDAEKTLKELPLAKNCEISPVFGKIGRKKNEVIEFATPQNILVQEEDSESEDSDGLTPLNRYQELCSSTVSENFSERNRLEDDVPDPHSVAKAMLRNVYASTFSSTYLQKKIRAGINLEDPEIPTVQTPSTDECHFTRKSWRTPVSSKVVPRCSQVDTATSENQLDNRQSDSALEASGNFETEVVDDRPDKFLDFFTKNSQSIDVPVKRQEAKRIESSSRQESLATETIREVNAGKRVSYEREVNDESQNIQRLVMNRNIAKRRTKTVLFRTNDSEKLKQLSQEVTQARNQSVQHVPTILRRKKIIQTLKSNHSNVKTRSRRVKEARSTVFEEPPEKRYPVREEFIPERTFHSHRVETPRIINEMYEDKRNRNHEQPARSKSQDSYLSMGYESMGPSSLPRDESYNFLSVRTIDKPETITTVAPQHQQDVVYISRKACLRNCARISDGYQIEPKALESHQVPRELYIQQHLYPKACNPRSHQCPKQEVASLCGRLCTQEFVQRKQEERKLCESEHYVLRSCKDHPRCSTENLSEYSKVQKPRHFRRENLPEASILDGVGKLQILNDDWEDARVSRHGNKSCNSTILFTDSTQPVKYLACEDSSETRRIPIYPRESSRVNESSRKPKRNHHASCAKVPQGYILVPACKQSGKVVYVKPGPSHCSDFVHEDCRTCKLVFQDDPSRTHHVHREMKNECEGSYALTEDGADVCCNQTFTKIAR